MVGCLVDHPTNTITLVVPFATTVAQQWRINQPYPWELLWNGLDEGSIQEFHIV